MKSLYFLFLFGLLFLSFGCLETKENTYKKNTSEEENYLNDGFTICNFNQLIYKGKNLSCVYCSGKSSSVVSVTCNWEAYNREED